MKPVFTKNGTIVCVHGGTGEINPLLPDTFLRIDGNSCYSTVSGTITGCPFAPGGVASPCVTFTIDGTSNNLQINSAGVVLMGDSGSTNNGSGMAIVTAAGQEKVFTI